MKMMTEKKRLKLAAISSLLVHLLLIGILSAAGIFALAAGEKQRDVLEVALYEVGAGGEPAGGGGGGSAAEAEFAAGGFQDLPAISEVYTTEPQKQQEYRQAAEKNSIGTGQGKTAGGEGAGTGKGTGTGSGTGNGNGNGNGNGSGNGRGEALQPKVPPQITRAVAPVYPAALQQQGVEGSVKLRFVVGSNGQIEEVSIVASSGYPEMDEAALAAAEQYVFSPAENVYGVPVRCAVTRKVVFRLQ